MRVSSRSTVSRSKRAQLAGIRVLSRRAGQVTGSVLPLGAAQRKRTLNDARPPQRHLESWATIEDTALAWTKARWATGKQCLKPLDPLSGTFDGRQALAFVGEAGAPRADHLAVEKPQDPRPSVARGAEIKRPRAAVRKAAMHDANDPRDAID
jgi:hypothetical protein